MATTTLTPELTGTYLIDPAHSRIGFVARHAMVTKVRGAFTQVDASGYFDAEDPTRSKLEAAIQAASIDTGSPDRDDHLRSGDFLDVEHHPQITFTSTDIEQVDEAGFRLTGDLTIRGVTRLVTLDVKLAGPATDPFGNQRLGLEARATINRKDWGVTWNAVLEAGGVLVSEKVALEIDISAIRAGEED